MHLHYHACEVCSFSVPFRKHGEKGLKMCPCREAFYCGEEHQKAHWKIHRRTCYNRKHAASGPPSPMDLAIQHLLQFHDTSIVEIAVMALLKENIDVNFREELEKKAVVLTVEPLDGKEDDAAAVTDSKQVPLFRVSREVTVVSLEDHSRQMGLDRPFFEDPTDRHFRIRRKRLGIAIVFLPSGRAVTKSAPDVQLGVWEMVQEKERTTTNPPMLYWQIMMTNSRIKIDLELDKDGKKKRGASEKELAAQNASRTGVFDSGGQRK